MATTTDVPVTMEPAAAARAAELGLEKELQQVLEHVKQTFPGLHCIKVVLDERWMMGEEDGVLVRAFREGPSAEAEEDLTDRDFGRWRITTFPPQVWSWLAAESWYERPDGR